MGPQQDRTEELTAAVKPFDNLMPRELGSSHSTQMALERQDLGHGSGKG